MPRGGFREKSGRKSPWKSGETRTIRVPETLADRLMEIARWLDQGGSIDFVSESKIESVTKPKAANDCVTKSESADGWMTTREVWERLGQPKPWNTFRSFSPERLLKDFNVEADPSRKVKGKTDSRWLRFVD